MRSAARQNQLDALHRATSDGSQFAVRSSQSQWVGYEA